MAWPSRIRPRHLTMRLSTIRRKDTGGGAIGRVGRNGVLLLAWFYANVVDMVAWLRGNFVDSVEQQQQQQNIVCIVVLRSHAHWISSPQLKSSQKYCDVIVASVHKNSGESYIEQRRWFEDWILRVKECQCKIYFEPLLDKHHFQVY